MAVLELPDLFISTNIGVNIHKIMSVLKIVNQGRLGFSIYSGYFDLDEYGCSEIMFSTTVLLPLTLLFIATGQIVAKDLPVYQLPPYVKKACARNDPNFNQCVVEVGNAALKSVVKGDAKYRIPVLNPMLIKELIIRQGTKQFGLNLICKDCKLLGLENVVFVKSDLNFATHHHRWDFTLDKMKVVGKYNVSGQILLLPINGAGDAEFNIEKLKFSFIFVTAFEERNKGRMYVKIVNGSFPIDAEHMTIKLDNLFNGDKLLVYTITSLTDIWYSNVRIHDEWL